MIGRLSADLVGAVQKAEIGVLAVDPISGVLLDRQRVPPGTGIDSEPGVALDHLLVNRHGGGQVQLDEDFVSARDTKIPDEYPGEDLCAALGRNHTTVLPVRRWRHRDKTGCSRP